MRLQVSGCRLQAIESGVSGDPEKLKIFTRPEDLKLIASLEESI